MTEKQKLIEAFKSLDFEALQNLLDDNRSYVDVTKDLFLSRLKEEIESLEIKSFDKVEEEEGCNSCNKNCKSYCFENERDCITLHLCIEEINGRVTNIHGNSNLEGDIEFSFYEDEKVNFKPTLEYLLNVQKFEKAFEEFKKLEFHVLVPAIELVYWYDKYVSLVDELELKYTHEIKYGTYIQFGRLHNRVYDVVYGYKNSRRAKQELIEYYNINAEDERMIVKWLLKSVGCLQALEKTENWKKTGILILETEIKNLVVDCSDCLDSFFLDEVYYKHHWEIWEKYLPTKEQLEKTGGWNDCTLESHLRFHNKYLDLL